MPQNNQTNTPKKDNSEKSYTSHQILTPKKTAKFATPEKKQLTRKKATTGPWKKNIRKRLRFREYTSPHSGKKYKQVPKRAVKSPCTNCWFKCVTVFTEENRQKTFDSFWNFRSYERQKDSVCSRIEEKKTRPFER